MPAVTISVWPSGWVCHAVRAPGSNVTLAPRARAGSAASNRGSTRTDPVKYSAGPFPDGREPHLLISMTNLHCYCVYAATGPLASRGKILTVAARACAPIIGFRYGLTAYFER